MLIFWRLLLAHLLADFTFQSNFINSWKRRSLSGMLAHCGMHAAAFILLTWPFLGRAWVETRHLKLTGWVCVFLIFVLHFIEDQSRVASVFRRDGKDTTLYFLWDQFFHTASIVIFLPLGLAEPGEGWFPETWTVLACLFVAITHFTTVFIYFLEKDLWGTDFPDFDEKYLTMAGRIVLALCLMLPGMLAVWTGAAWLALTFHLRRRRVIEYSWLNLSIGAAVGLFCGLVGRGLYYGRIFV